MSAGFLLVLKEAALMAQKATIRTAGIVGDDLAINCKQLMGAQPERELPMVWSIAKGSLKNKAILIPCALALSVTFPWLIMPALTAGGAFLCYEGVEKFLHKNKPEKPGKSESAVHDHEAWEKRRIKKAIKTDLILSCEIVAVALWTVAGAPFIAQAIALAAAGIAMTAGVYGIVAAVTKLDDLGNHMAKKEGKGFGAKLTRGVGRAIAKGAPAFVKTIGVVGTVAMFLVGGGMVVHGIPGGEHMLTQALTVIGTNPAVHAIGAGAAEAVAGVAAGILAIPVMKVIEPPIAKLAGLVTKLKNKIRPPKPDPREEAEEKEEMAPEAPAPATPAVAAAPDVKADLNAAAKPAANENVPPPPSADKIAPPKGPVA